jgi:hypothetical protein
MSSVSKGYCFPTLLLLLATIYAGSNANAQDTAWHVSKSSGEVWITGSGVQKASVTDQTILHPGDSIRTGQTGRVLLMRGEETMLISPNSIIGISREKRDGMSTIIHEQAGSVLLEVERQNVKHFEVDTPYLAAVVKGTKFSVTVEKGASRVDVVRGQVEVQDFKSGQYALVTPGQTANVSSQGTYGLSLSGSGTIGPVQQGRPRSSPVNPVAMPADTNPAPVKPETPEIQASSQSGETASSNILAGQKPGNETQPFARVRWASEPEDDAWWPRHDNILSALALPAGLGVFVAFSVTAYRQRQKRKQKQG